LSLSEAFCENASTDVVHGEFLVTSTLFLIIDVHVSFTVRTATKSPLATSWLRRAIARRCGHVLDDTEDLAHWRPVAFMFAIVIFQQAALRLLHKPKCLVHISNLDEIGHP
jgi:hypothetical protein